MSDYEDVHVGFRCGVCYICMGHKGCGKPRLCGSCKARGYILIQRSDGTWATLKDRRVVTPEVEKLKEEVEKWKNLAYKRKIKRADTF